MKSLQLRLIDLHLRLLRLTRDDRGDVPGWVLITVMTAGLVIVIWGVASPALSEVFDKALKSVSSFSPQ